VCPAAAHRLTTRRLSCFLGATQTVRITALCCSTFVVSRDRIRSRPLAMYNALLDWLHSTVRAFAQLPLQRVCRHRC
jgi:hypothetical protein